MNYIVLSLLFIAQSALGAGIITDAVVKPGSGTYLKNFVKNPFCEKNNLNVVLSNTTLARDIDSADKLNNVSSCLITTSSSSNSAYFSINTLDNDVVGNCEASAMFKSATAATDGFAFVVDNGSGTTLASVLLSNESGWKKVTLNYPCTASARPGFVNLTTGKTLNIGNVYWGVATNIGSVASASLIGSAYFAQTTSCTWARTNTALGAFSTTAACPAPTVEYNAGPGSIQTTDADLPKITVNNLPPGEYEVTASAYFNTTANNDNTVAISDGTTVSGKTGLNSANTVAIPVTMVATFSYSTVGNRTFEIFGSSASGAITLYNAFNNATTRFVIKRFPTSAEQGVRMDQSAQSWSGYHDNTCSWSRTNTALGDPTADASCNLVERKNNNFGTVSASGSVLPAITFTPSKAGNVYWVCSKFSLYGSSANAIVLSRLWDGTTVISDSLNFSAAANSQFPITHCGIYVAPSISATTLSIRTAADTGANVLGSNAGITSAIEWSIVNISQSFPSSLITNSVVQPSAGIEAPIRLSGTCSSSASVSSNQTGVTIGNVSSGACVITLPAYYSAAPVCPVSFNNSTLGVLETIASTATSATSVTVYGRDVTAGLSSFTFNMICMGAK